MPGSGSGAEDRIPSAEEARDRFRQSRAGVSDPENMPDGLSADEPWRKKVKNLRELREHDTMSLPMAGSLMARKEETLW